MCKLCNDVYSEWDILVFGQHFCCNGKRVPPEQIEYDTTKKVYKMKAVDES